MKLIELYYDHYKDTFSNLQKSITKRNKLFSYLYLVLFISILFKVNASQSESIINSYTKYHLNLDMPYDFSIIQTFLRIVLLYLTLIYSQKVVYIERQYKYIHRLESIIKVKVKQFDREGFSYLNNYPLLLNVIHFFYNYILPSLYILSVFYLILLEWLYRHSILLVIINSIVSLFSIFIYVLYIIFMKKKK